MQLSLGEIIVIVVFGLAGAYLLSSHRVRELALQAVARASKADDFQLLDQSVHVQRVSLSRDDEGRWRIWRQYRFEYSYDGVERLQGTVVMLGQRMQSLIIAESGRTLH